MQPQNTKSSVVAGLLGIFLGAFGAHNWYLGEKNKGIIHVCLMSGGVLVEIIAAIILPNILNPLTLLQMAGFLYILTIIAGIAMSASGLWGLIEGVTILSQGDAGLASKGYAVANQGYGPNQNYGYQNGPQGYNNYGPQGYNNYGPQGPMNNGYPQQPPMGPQGPNNYGPQGPMGGGQNPMGDNNANQGGYNE